MSDLVLAIKLELVPVLVKPFIVAWAVPEPSKTDVIPGRTTRPVLAIDGHEIEALVSGDDLRRIGALGTRTNTARGSVVAGIPALLSPVQREYWLDRTVGWD